MNRALPDESFSLKNRLRLQLYYMVMTDGCVCIDLQARSAQAEHREAQHKNTANDAA